MKPLSVFLVFATICISSCRDRSGPSDHPDPANARLTCLFTGYDSCIYYIGPSSQMTDVTRGKVTNAPFVLEMLQKIKRHRLSLMLKPGDGGDCVANLQQLKIRAIRDGISDISIDSTDANEEKTLGVITAPPLRDMMHGKEAFHLALPRQEDPDPATDERIAKFPTASRFTIILSANNEIYGYSGDNIDKGKDYTYPELTELLKSRRSDSSFIAIIKPDSSATYKNTIDILDEMKTAGITHYALVDITRKEIDFLQKMKHTGKI